VPPLTLGRLAVDWDAAAYQRTGRLRIAHVVALGPAAVAGHLAAGDELLAVGGTPVERTTDVDELLANRIGKRTELRVAPRGDGAAARTVVVLPVDRDAETRLRYLEWVAQRRAYVEKISGGRLGYVHIFDMGEESLEKFYADLDVQNRAKAGVVVDVRNNTGGFVDPYAIDVLTRREFLTFKTRFGYDAPERTQLGERALNRPSILVTNEHSLSDAENFTEAYRQLHAGLVVGEPTAGWIIFTSNVGLADGGTVRLPATRVFAHDGVDMELHPRPVDVRVANPPGAAERGDDPQLDAAVRELLRRAGGRR
jgi:C-terminal processing protease CtpA/Prc